MVILCLLLCLCLSLQGCKKETHIEKPGTLITNTENSSEKSQTSEDTGNVQGTKNASTNTEKEESELLYADGITETEGDVNNQVVQAVNNELNKIPDSIISQFQKYGWHIYVTDSDINEKYYSGKYSTVFGTTQYADKEIYIVDTIDAAHESAIHEMGHFVDYSNGILSDQEDFKELYFSEARNYIKSYEALCIRDRKELFAEVFWQYTVNPSKLQLETPGLYTYMKNIIQSIYSE